MCKKFFEVDDTSYSERVKIALIYLEGKALMWHLQYMKSIGTRQWPSRKDCKQAICTRFCKHLFDDSHVERMELR